jgi:hypothetical protein
MGGRVPAGSMDLLKRNENGKRENYRTLKESEMPRAGFYFGTVAAAARRSRSTL